LEIKEKLHSFDQKHRKKIDCVAAALLALCPLLQHYKAPLFNAAITVLVVVAVYLCICMLPKLKNFKFAWLNLTLVLIIYQIFRVVNHGTTVSEVGQSGVFIIFLLALSMGLVDLKFLLKAAKVVAMIAAAALILQYICYYIFGFHLQMVPTSLLIPSAEQWILGAQTGKAGITGNLRRSYRPSAFFLEPSHAYLYMFPHLFLLLFSGKATRKNLLSALLITVGMMLTTSGMGVVAAVCAWALFAAIYDFKTGTFSLRNILRKRNLIAIGCVAVVLIVVVSTVPIIRGSFIRIVYNPSGGSTAIGGRINRALKLVAGFTPLQWIFGVADNTHGINFNIPGLVDALYRHGLIGLVLSYEFYVKGLLKLKLAYVLVAAVILVTSLFSAHTHSTVGMLNFVFILTAGYREMKETGEASFWRTSVRKKTA